MWYSWGSIPKYFTALTAPLNHPPLGPWMRYPTIPSATVLPYPSLVPPVYLLYTLDHTPKYNPIILALLPSEICDKLQNFKTDIYVSEKDVLKRIIVCGKNAKILYFRSSLANNCQCINPLKHIVRQIYFP